MTRKRYDEDFKKQIVKIYNQGNHSYRSLADEYGVATPTIRTWVLRYNNSLIIIITTITFQDRRRNSEGNLRPIGSLACCVFF